MKLTPGANTMMPTTNALNGAGSAISGFVPDPAFIPSSQRIMEPASSAGMSWTGWPVGGTT